MHCQYLFDEDSKLPRTKIVPSRNRGVARRKPYFRLLRDSIVFNYTIPATPQFLDFEPALRCRHVSRNVSRSNNGLFLRSCFFLL